MRLNNVHLAKEIDDEKVQDDRSQHELGQCAALRDARTILGISTGADLHAQGQSQYELADRGSKPGQERVERIVGEHDAVDKLQNPRDE